MRLGLRCRRDGVSHAGWLFTTAQQGYTEKNKNQFRAS
jgi:hypothetical protein